MLNEGDPIVMNHLDVKLRVILRTAGASEIGEQALTEQLSEKLEQIGLRVDEIKVKLVRAEPWTVGDRY